MKRVMTRVLSLPAELVTAAAHAKTMATNAGPAADATATKHLSQQTHTNIVRALRSTGSARFPAAGGGR